MSPIGLEPPIQLVPYCGVEEDALTPLIDQTIELRRGLAAFERKFKPCFEAFCQNGTPFPDDFGTTHHHLKEQRQKLVEQIAQATAAVPSDQWESPTAKSSLTEIAHALNHLKDLCRKNKQKMQQQVRDVLQPLQTINQLACRVPTKAWLESDLRALPKLLAEIEETLHQDARAIFDEQIHTKLNGLQALLTLVQWGTDSKSASSPPHNMADAFDDIHDCFDQVSQLFSQRLALATLQGLVQIKEIPTESPQEGIIKLQTKFSGGLLTPSHQPNPTPAPSPPALAWDALETLPCLIKNVKQLRERADALSPASSKDTHDANIPEADRIRAAGFRNLAKITQHIITIIQHRGENKEHFRTELHDALKLLAEAQNAVRVENEQQNPHGHPIKEQDTLFRWLRTISHEDREKFHIEHYMALSDPADPSNHRDLAQRIQRVSQNWLRARQAETLLPAIEQLMQQLSDHPTPEKWNQLEQTVEEFLRCKRRPSDKELRNIMLPFADLLIAKTQTDSEISDSLMQVTHHLQKYLNQTPASPSSPKTPHTTPEIAQVARLLSGKVLALVAGIPKNETKERLIQAFQLSDLIWVPASSSDRVDDLKPRIHKADIVVLITKLIGHKHNALRDYCRELGIVCVQTRVNAGYGTSQIARSILEQASDQLGPSNGTTPPSSDE